MDEKITSTKIMGNAEVESVLGAGLESRNALCATLMARGTGPGLWNMLLRAVTKGVSAGTRGRLLALALAHKQIPVALTVLQQATPDTNSQLIFGEFVNKCQGPFQEINGIRKEDSEENLLSTLISAWKQLSMEDDFPKTAKASFMHLLFDMVFEMKAWDCLQAIDMNWKQFDCKFEIFKVMLSCLEQILKETAPKAKLAPVLCNFIKIFRMDKEALLLMQKSILTKESRPKLHSLASWCLKNGNSKLAFLLGFVLDDKTAVCEATSKESFDFTKWACLEGWVTGLLEKELFTTAAALMKQCKLTLMSAKIIAKSLDAKQNSYWVEFASAFEKAGLMNLVLLMVPVKHLENMKSIGKEKFQKCKNQGILNEVLKTAIISHCWRLVKDLCHFSSNTNLLNAVLKVAVKSNQLDVVQELVNKADVSKLPLVDKSSSSPFSSISTPTLRSFEMVKLLISAGISTHQRIQESLSDDVWDSFVVTNLKEHFPSALTKISLYIKSGAVPMNALEAILAENPYEMFNGEDYRSRDEKRIQRQGLKIVEKAARNPNRLDHLARLAVSHRIGCQPGRQARVASLSVPQSVKDLINFKDVLSEFKSAYGTHDWELSEVDTDSSDEFDLNECYGYGKKKRRCAYDSDSYSDSDW